MVNTMPGARGPRPGKNDGGPGQQHFSPVGRNRRLGDLLYHLGIYYAGAVSGLPRGRPVRRVACCPGLDLCRAVSLPRFIVLDSPFVCDYGGKRKRDIPYSTYQEKSTLRSNVPNVPLEEERRDLRIKRTGDGGEDVSLEQGVSESLLQKSLRHRKRVDPVDE